MRNLLLMRHAKAGRESGVSDHARSLTDRGRSDARLVAGFLQANGAMPDLALASDSQRTRETLEIACESFDPAPVRKLDAGLYLAEPGAILRAIRSVPAETKTLLVVGHNPGIAELALALTDSGAPDDVRSLASAFPTSAVAVLEFQQHWARLTELGGRLERFILAKPLREQESR
jgi:phosphohistidine phosphatase